MFIIIDNFTNFGWLAHSIYLTSHNIHSPREPDMEALQNFYQSQYLIHLRGPENGLVWTINVISPLTTREK